MLIKHCVHRGMFPLSLSRLKHARVAIPRIQRTLPLVSAKREAQRE